MPKLIARKSAVSAVSTNANFPIRRPGLHINEIPLQGLIRIQGDEAEVRNLSGVEGLTSLVDVSARTLQAASAGVLARTAPKEWLFFCDVEAEQLMLQRITRKFEEKFVAVTLASDSRVGFHISGDDAQAIVEQGCSIDVDSTVFPVGNQVITRFAGLPTMLIRSDTDSYSIYIETSQVAYLVEWLVNVAEAMPH